MREELLKIASTRAMREFLKGSLSPSGSATVRSYLPSMERLTAGLNTGSDNILNRYGYTQRNTSSLTGTVRKALEDNPRSTFKGADSVNTSAAQQYALDKLVGPHTNSIKKEIVLDPGKLVPRRATKQQSAYSDAMIKRHEADEVRYSGDKRNPTSKSLTPTPWSGRRKLPGGVLKEHVQVATGAHNSPRVLLQESRNAALGDSKVKGYFQKLRGAGNENLESAALARAGVRYGETAPVGSSALNKANKSVWRQDAKVNLPREIGDAGKVFVSKKLYDMRSDPTALKSMMREEASGLLNRFKKKLPWNKD